jgi:hypothetical protein
VPLAASLGTASAEDQDGKHEMKRAPAAITSLSAASRCASRPPSDPSGSIPPIQEPVSNDRLPAFLGHNQPIRLSSGIHSSADISGNLKCHRKDASRIIFRFGQHDGFCHFDGDAFCRTAPQSPPFVRLLEQTRKIFFARPSKSETSSENELGSQRIGREIREGVQATEVSASPMLLLNCGA